MRKTFTLLCMGVLFASTAIAKPFTPETGANMKFAMSELSEQQIEVMKANSARARMIGDPNVITRSSVIDGVTWNFSLLNTGEFTQFGIYSTDENGNRNDLTFEDMPVYVGQMEVWSDDDKNQLMYLLCWPSEYLFTQFWQEDFDHDNVDSWNREPVQPSVLMNSKEEGFNTFQWCSFLTYSQGQSYIGDFPANWLVEDDNIVGLESWCMIGINAIYTNNILMDGVETIAAENDASRRTSVEFESFDKTSDNVQFMLRAYGDGVTVVNNNRIPTGRSYQKNVAYNGAPYQIRGFEHLDFNLTAYETHIFYTGEYDNDELGDLGYTEPDKPTMKRYYMWSFCSELLTLGIHQGFNDPQWSDDKYGFAWKEGVTENQMTDEEVRFFQGALYTPADVEKFPSVQVWNMMEPEYTIWGSTSYMSNYPKSFEIIPSVYSDIYAQNDGMTGGYNGRWIYSDTPSLLQLGSTEGMVMYLADMVEDSYVVKSAAGSKIFFHPNPENSNEYEELDPFGSEAVLENPTTASVLNLFVETPALNVKVNGRNIEAPAGSMVYDMNGRRVNANGVAAGIYVVRNGRQATKVLVK